MKNTLLASVAFLCVGTSMSFAAMPSFDLEPVFSTTTQNDVLILAKDGNSGGGNSGSGSSNDGGSDDSDDSGDDNGGGSGGSDDDNDSGDDHGGNSSSNDNSNDDSPQSNSNRRRPRVPGGSGCDDAGDIAEHAECRVQ